MSKSTHQRKSRTNVCARSIQASGKALPLRRTWPISLCVGLAVGSIVFSGDALAGGPTGGVVVGGTGSIIQSGNSTVINQASQKLALNWQTFNVGASESVLFNQPGRSAVALNRILDQNPSQIFGRISSNGQIFLINTHGIIFGATAQMNVGGLLASTLDLTPNDFLAGHYNLNASGAGAGIVNHGLIQAASGGSVALVGGSVLNDGLIFANYGKINLDGADHAVLDFDGNGLINIQITGELKQRLDQREAAVTNKGTLRAEDGTVVLQASATKDLFTGLVNNTGVIDASGISTDGGVVRLVGNGGNVESSGSIDVSGVHGGSAQLLSDANVGVTGRIDASGEQGGGSIRVGGGYQGGEGLTTANVTYLGPDAVLDADATGYGNGGSVVLWGNQGNNFLGRITARGGALGGNGGLVETSSHYGLNAQGSVDASSPRGRAGTWLIDPYDITIQTGAGTLSSPFTASADSTIKASDLNTALNGTNVTVFTGSSGTSNGDITVNAAIKPSAGDNALYLKAAGGIYVNADISAADASHKLDLYLWSNYGGTAAGTSYVSNASCAALVSCVVTVGSTANAAIATNGGLADVETGIGGGAFTLGVGSKTGSINTGTGVLTVHATGISEAAGANTITAGAATLDAGAGAMALGNAGNNFSGAVSLSNSGANDIVLNNGTHALNLAASTLGSGALTISATGISQSGAITQAASAAGATFNAGAGAISLGNAGNNFTGPVSLNNSGANAVTLNNGTHALDLATSALGSGALTVSAAGISQGGKITQAASAGAATFNAGTNAISLTDAGNAFTGAVSLAGSNVSLVNSTATLLGATTATGTLDVGSNGALSQSGALTVTGAATFTQNSTTAGAAQDVNLGSQNNSFQGGVTFAAGAGAGINNLSLKNIFATPATLTLPANVAGMLTLNYTNAALTVPLAGVVAGGLDLTAGSGITINGNVSTSGAQAYHSAVTLGADAILASSGSGNIGFDSTVDGAYALTVNTGGATSFGGAVGGATTLTSLTTDAGGSTMLGGNVTTSGAQTYNDALTLGGDATLASSGAGAINLGSTVDGAHALAVNTGGATTFGGAVGGTTALTSLTTDAGGGTTLNGNVSTTGAQTYGDAMTLGANATLTGTTVGLAAVTGAGNNLTVTGNAVLAGVVSGVNALQVSGTTNLNTASVSTSGGQTYSGAVTLGVDTTLASSGSGAIGFGSTVNGAHALTVNTGGTTSFGGAIGGTTALTSLTTNAGGSTMLGGNVTTSGAQAYNDAVTLGTDVTLATTNGAVSFGSTVDNATATKQALTVNAGTGAVTFTGALGNGGNGALASLATNSGTFSANALNIGSGGLAVTTTTGGIAQGGAFKVAGTSSFNAGSGAITLTNSGNDFTGAVSLGNSGANDVAVSDANALVLGASTIGSGALTLTATTGISQTGAIVQAAGGGAVTLDAGAGDLALTDVGNDFTGPVTASGQAVRITDATALDMVGFTSASNKDVSLVAGGQLTLAPTITAIDTGSGNLTLSSGTSLMTQGSLSGNNVSLTGASGLTLNNDITATGTLTLASSTGGISQIGGNILAGGTSSVAGGTGAVSLTSVGNDFTGTVTASGGSIALTDTNALTAALTTGGNAILTAGGNLAVSGSSNNLITNAAATSFGTTTVGGSLSTTAAGAISQTGALSVTGTSSLAAGANAITLSNSSNDFTGAVGLSNSGANNVSIRDTNGLILGNVNVGTGTLGVQAVGITQAAGTTIVQSAAAGAANFNSGGGVLTLANIGNDFTGAVNLAGGTTQITDANALTLGTLATGALTATSTGALNLGSGTVTGNLAATSNNGAIGQTGALAVTGSSTINAGSGTITLTNSGNDFTGAVSLGNSGANNVSIRDTNGLILGNVNVGTGTLGVQAVGITQAAGTAIVQSAAAGAANFNSGGGVLTLANTGNDFTGAVNLTGGATQITDTNALTLGTLGTGALTAVSHGALNLGSGTVTGNLAATSNNGAISQTGALAVTGSSTINAGSGTITLTNSGNDFTGAVSLAGGTTQVTDTNALTLGTLGTGALTAVSHGALNLGSGTVTGNLIATSNNGAIGQAGALHVTGSSTINAGSAAIALTNANNDFGSAVTATGTGVQITDANNLAIAGLASGANGTVSLIAGGVLTLPAGAIDTGTANLTLVSNGGSLTTPGALSGANVSLTGHGGVTLNSNVTAAGTLSLVSGAAISQGAGIITAGTLTGSSVGNTTLSRANKIGTLGSFSAANFSLTNAQALTVNGPLTTTGNAGDIDLETTGGALVVNANLASDTVALTSAGNLALSKNLQGSTVALVSGGSISQGGGVITAATLTGSAVGSTTLNQANKVAALGAFSSTGFSFTNGQTLTVNGPLNGGASVALTTTAGNLAISGAVSGTTTTLKSAGAISESATGGITAATLTGQSNGATALNGANHIGSLGSFSAANFALTNAQALTVSGPVSGGASTALTTTAGNLVVNGAVSGTTTTLKSAGTISEGAGGSIVAGTLAGQSSGATTLNGVNHVGALGNFSAANFALTNAQALTVSGPVNGGASTTLTTTAGDLAINGAVSGTTTTLHSAAAITEGAGGSITANLLTGHSIGNATLDGDNHIDTLGSFTSDFSLTNAQTLTVVGPLDGGPSVALTTTAGDLIINGTISGTTTTLKSAGTISQGAAGSITASTLTGQSGGATTLNGSNHIGTLGSFTAAGFALTNAQALTVDGPVAGGSSTMLATSAGNLAINGAVSGAQTTLNSAGAISEGSGGVITAATLSGSAAGGTTLGSATHRVSNMVDTLGNFSSPAGFSMTNNKTLTLASVAGSAFTVNAGTSAFYLSVTNGDLFQLGTTPVYNGMGTWGSTGRMGTGAAPIYVIGTGLQTVANIGMPPAYFYAVDSGGNLLPLGGGLAVNVPTASGAGSAQNGNHGDSYVDPSVITANYRSYGIVPSGVRLPADQQAGCDPDQPDQLDCEGGDTVGMVRMMMNVRR